MCVCVCVRQLLPTLERRSSSCILIRRRCHTKMTEVTNITTRGYPFSPSRCQSHRTKQKRNSLAAEPKALLATQRAAAWIVSTLKRSKNGKCLQCRGRVLYERAYTRRAGSVSSQDLTRLICFHFSPPAWRMVPADRCLRSRRFSVITRSVLFSPPHGVHLPAVDLGNGENESQVLGLSWNNISF